MPTQPLVLSTLAATSSRQAQLMMGGVVSRKLIVWLQLFELPQRSVRVQVRVMDFGQTFVTVEATVTVTLLPLQASAPTGGSNVKGEPHATVLLVTWDGQRATTDTSSKK